MSTYQLAFNSSKRRLLDPNPIGRAHDDIEADEPPSKFKMPLPILKMITTHARKMATNRCSVRNYSRIGDQLATDKQQQRCPKQLEFKFKKNFIRPEEAGLRAIMIGAATDTEIDRLATKAAALDNEFENRLDILKETLNPVLTACNMSLDDAELLAELDFQIQTFKAAFIIKQTSDEAKKAKKAAKFLEYKEIAETEVKLTAKQVKSMTSTIASLQKSLKKLTISGKGKGPTDKRPSAGPKKKGKSTGTRKNSGGNGNASARNKSSRGKNGKK